MSASYKYHFVIARLGEALALLFCVPSREIATPSSKPDGSQ
jgi:hypothetical protein